MYIQLICAVHTEYTLSKYNKYKSYVLCKQLICTVYTKYILHTIYWFDWDSMLYEASNNVDYK